MSTSTESSVFVSDNSGIPDTTKSREQLLQFHLTRLQRKIPGQRREREGGKGEVVPQDNRHCQDGIYIHMYQ